MLRPLKVLIVETDANNAERLVDELRRAGFEPDWKRVDTEDAFLGRLQDGLNLILSDYHMPQFSGLRALELLREGGLDVPFILVSGTAGEDFAVKAMKHGATDYLLRTRLASLGQSVSQALETYRLRAERKMVDERLLLQGIALETAANAVMLTDVQGTILWVNPAFTVQTGYSSQEALGQTPRLLKSGKHDAVFYGNLWTTVLAGMTWRGCFANRRKDGSLYFDEHTITPVRAKNGLVTHFVTIMNDVSDRKKLEEQSLRAQRLESIGMLAAGIAHDLNNVLSPIVLVTPLLRESVQNPRDLRLLDTLEKCAERGAGLVRQILGFVHGIGEEPRIVQVRHLLRDVVDLMNETFPKSIKVHEDLPNDLWPILANPTQIHQVLFNLCVNARDAMPTGGMLSLRAENIVLDRDAAAAIDSARPGPYLALHIEDTGTGISPSALAHIWEPFFTTKSAENGTGLGLSTVRGIVETHQGFVTVTTEVGQGTTFNICLPARESAIVLPDPAASQSVHACGHNELILLVDDEAMIRDLAHSILKNAGYRVLTASDGYEAAMLFEANSAEIALVITDSDMPVVDGAELAKTIHGFQIGTQILSMSGLGSLETVGSVHPKRFADAFIAKPFSAEALLNTVVKLLKNKTIGKASV